MSVFSHIRDFVTGAAGFVTGVVGLVTGIAFLVDFMGSRTELVDSLRPSIGALLPVVAVGAAAGGLVLVLGSALTTAWRWYVPRSAGERFQQLAPAIRAITHSMAALPHLPNPAQEIDEAVAFGIVARELSRLGIALPTNETDALGLLILATQGEVKTARRAFPLQAGEEQPIAELNE